MKKCRGNEVFKMISNTSLTFNPKEIKRAVETAQKANKKGVETLHMGRLKKLNNGEYLASILDLEPKHINLLESLRNKIKDHLLQVYNVNESDSTMMYIHFPYADHAAGLHVHIRVNQLFHPFEENQSFTLDSIILHLKNNGDIFDLILEKQDNNGGKFYSDHPMKDINYLSRLEGITIFKRESNPFRINEFYTLE